MAAKLNVIVTIAAVFAAGACLRAAAAFPSHYAVAFEDEDEASAAVGSPQPEHHQHHEGPSPSHAAHSYHFQYAVHDPLTGDEKSHNEVSDGHGTVTGTYTVVEADGSKRVVEYTADDEHGFRAEVKKIEPPKSRKPVVAPYTLEKLEHQKSPPPPPPYTPVHEEQYHYVPESYPSSH